jgi:hypothetical protein
MSTPTATEKNVFRGGLQKHSFIGRECKILLSHYKSIIDMVSPPISLSQDVKRHSRRDSALWQSLSDVWEALHREWDNVDSTEERESVANQVRIRAADFCRQFHKATSGGTYYSHILVAHMPDFIRRFGDLSLFSSQGVEHLHKIRKELLHNKSNKRAVGTDKNGRKMTKGRTAQSMQALIVGQHVRQQLPIE